MFELHQRADTLHAVAQKTLAGGQDILPLEVGYLNVFSTVDQAFYDQLTHHPVDPGLTQIGGTDDIIEHKEQIMHDRFDNMVPGIQKQRFIKIPLLL